MSDGIEIMNTAGIMWRPSIRDVEVISRYKHELHKLDGWKFMGTLRDLLLAGFCLLLLIGCRSTAPDFVVETITPNAFSVTVQAIEAKQDETLSTVKANTQALQDIKTSLDNLEGALVNSDTANSQEVISESTSAEQSADAETESPDKNANDSQPRNTVVAASGDSVPLIVTYASFNCHPCERLKKDIAAGKFDGFEITVDNEWKPKSYPAIRYPWKTDTGWAVEYGYDAGMADRLRAKLMPKKVQTAALSPMSTQDMIETHNSLHGGGSWTWPGDLAEHLRNTHGVQVDGIGPHYSGNQVIRSRSAVRSVSWWPFGNRRQNFVSRSSCPSGNCP